MKKQIVGIFTISTGDKMHLSFYATPGKEKIVMTNPEMGTRIQYSGRRLVQFLRDLDSGFNEGMYLWVECNDDVLDQLIVLKNAQAQE